MSWPAINKHPVWCIWNPVNYNQTVHTLSFFFPEASPTLISMGTVVRCLVSFTAIIIISSIEGIRNGGKPELDNQGFSVFRFLVFVESNFNLTSIWP